MEAILEGDWESLCNIFTFDKPDFVAQFLEHPTKNNSSSFFASSSIDNNDCFSYNPFSLPLNGVISDLLSDHASDTTSYNNIPSPIPNSYNESCQFSLPNEVFLPMINNPRLIDQQNHASFASVFPVEDDDSDNFGSPSPINQDVHVKRKCNAPEMQPENKLKAIPKKKARLTKDRCKDSIESSVKNAQETECNVGEEGTSDDDDESKVSQQASEVKILTTKEQITEDSKGKKRASRGTATDPQSLYARKRRMRINERLKILQNLVPNGTKVDISTMLEEAVNYVKFLQLQIQLLSSDDLWMYAPIAYNGVDINLYKQISPFRLA